MKKTSLCILLSIAAALIGTAPANATLYDTNTATYGLGDYVTLSGASGNFTVAGTYTINTVIFAGADYPKSLGSTFEGDFSGNTLTVTGVGLFPYLVHWKLEEGVTDTLTVGGNSFDIGGFKNPLHPPLLTVGMRATPTSILETESSPPPGAGPPPSPPAPMVLGLSCP